MPAKSQNPISSSVSILQTTGNTKAGCQNKRWTFDRTMENVNPFLHTDGPQGRLITGQKEAVAALGWIFLSNFDAKKREQNSQLWQP